MEAEAKQLHWRNSFRPVHWRDVDKERWKQILELHVFVKKKRTGQIKAHKVAGGNKQRDFISKENASSPTVAMESVLLVSLVADAQENRDVAIVDIPHALIQTVVENNEDKVIMRIRGHMVDVLVMVAPRVYGPYVSTDKQGRKQHLVECLNAIYGTVVASLLYYCKFTRSLKNQGYVMNP